MKDIDFDELDRAVSSLMGTSPVKNASAPPLQNATPTAQSIQSPPTPVNETVQLGSNRYEGHAVERQSLLSNREDTAKNQTSDVSAAIETSPKEPIVPQRKSGRFMDVVHPSSDMKVAGVGTIPKRRTVPMNIASSSSEHTDQPAVASPIVTPQSSYNPRPQSLVRTDTASEAPINKADSSWPDPLELHELSASQQTEKEQAKDVSADKTKISSDAPSANDTPPKTTEISASSEVMVHSEPETKDFSSPFLPNTKVEKRPLGVESDDTAASTVTVDNQASSNNESLQHLKDLNEESKEDSTESDQKPPTDPLPEELNKDIIAIEAGSSLHTPEDTQNITEKSSPKPHAETTEADGKVNLPLSGITSITQQYKVKPTHTNAEHAPIYDSSTEPLHHPVKAKSGWLTVLWILGLVILGVGGAAALYFLNII